MSHQREGGNGGLTPGGTQSRPSSKWGELPSVRMCRGPRPYHDAGEQAHALPAVGVGHHVAVADGEEGDGDEPHGPQEVAGHFLLVVVPEGEPGSQSVHTGPSAFITAPGAVPGRQGPGSTWLHGGLDCRKPTTLEAQSVQSIAVGQCGAMVATRDSPMVLLRIPQGRGHPYPPPRIPSNTLHSPDRQAARYGAVRGPGEVASTCVHA